MKNSKTLTFKQLRKQNLLRCGDFHDFRSWSPCDWVTALCGEVGEAANLVKKMRRGDKIDRQDLADELADVQCYLDLLAAAVDVDLGEATIKKFNTVSKRINSKVKL